MKKKPVAYQLMVRTSLPLFAFILLLLLSSCNDPTTVGGGIVDQEVIDVKQEDFPLSFEQVESRSFTTYPSALSELNRAQAGVLTDETFGKTETGFYMQLTPAEDFVSIDRTFIVDSITLMLFFDSTSSFGAHGDFSITVDRLDEKIEGDRRHMSDATFARGETLIDNYTFAPFYSWEDSSDIATGLAPHIRIPLDESLAEEVLSMDSVILNDDSTFVEHFYGLYVYPVDVEDQIVGFRPFATSSSVQTGIHIWYRNTIDDTTTSLLRLQAQQGNIYSPVIPVYQHDYTGSSVEEAFNDGDSLFYVQGLGGVSIDMSIHGLDTLNGTIINKAEFFVPIHENGDLYADKPPIRTLFLTHESLSGGRSFLPEFNEQNAYAFSPIGRLDTLNGVPGYFYNIPIQSSQILNRTVIDDVIRLQNIVFPADAGFRGSFGPRTVAEATARSIIKGTGMTEDLKIRITYSTE